MKRPLHVFNYSIRNQASGEVDIHIDGDIVDAETQAIWKAWFGDDTSTSYKSFRDQLNALDAQIYNVYINSGGGIVTDAMAIHDLLIDVQNKGKTVNTKGRGLIGSAATYILMAGRNAEMSKNSWFMVHNVGGGVYGDVVMVERYANTLRKFNDASRDFYASATGMRKEDITKMMNEETWLTAEQAKDKGFIKHTTGETNFNQAISKEDWPFSNMAVLNAYNSAVIPLSANEILIKQNLEEMKKFWQDLGTQIMNAIKGVKAPENNDHTTLMNSIAEAINKPFESAGEQLEILVNEAVKNTVTQSVDFSKDGDVKTAFDSAVKVAVENATKDFTTKITTLETANVEQKKKNEDLEKEITIIKGKASVPNKDDKAPKEIGQYN